METTLELSVFSTLILKSGLRSAFDAFTPRYDIASSFHSAFVGPNLTKDTVLNYTIFVPTNESFTGVPTGVMDALADSGVKPSEDNSNLRKLIKYHVLNETSVFTSCMFHPRVIVNTLEGQAIEIVSSLGVASGGGSAVLNGTSMVTTEDVMASNGVLHIVDRFLVPMSVYAFLPTVPLVDAARAAGFTAFADAVAGALIAPVLNDLGKHLTCFVPTNEAFAAAASVIAAGNETMETIREGLLAHCVQEFITYREVFGLGKQSESREGLTGLFLNFRIESECSQCPEKLSISSGVEQAQFVMEAVDMFSTSGIFHVIDIRFLNREPTLAPDSAPPTLTPYDPGAPSASPSSVPPSEMPKLSPTDDPSISPSIPPQQAPSIAPYKPGTPSAAPLTSSPDVTFEPSAWPSITPTTLADSIKTDVPSRAPTLPFSLGPAVHATQDDDDASVPLLGIIGIGLGAGVLFIGIVVKLLRDHTKPATQKLLHQAEELYDQEKTKREQWNPSNKPIRPASARFSKPAPSFARLGAGHNPRTSGGPTSPLRL